MVDSRFATRLDEYGGELLQQIGGLVCPEPTDFFIGGYTVPDTEDLLPGPQQEYIDRGKIRACTVGDEQHLRGRYQSNDYPSVAGDFELLLDDSFEHWTGTFTADGDPNEYGWSGFFQVHFDGDGADVVSDPPYGQETPEEPTSPTGPAPSTPPEDKTKCEDKAATITPNPDAPTGLAISGTASDDVIVGTDGPDRILGLGGNDIICGFGGDDELIGAEGRRHALRGLRQRSARRR